MPIKPLESKANKSVLFKALFLVTLVATGVLLDKIFLKKNQNISGVLGQTQEKIINKVQGSDLVSSSIKLAEDAGGAVLGEATSTITKLASDTGSYVSNVIYENSIGKVVDQIDKLPKDQQERIREQICK